MTGAARTLQQPARCSSVYDLNHAIDRQEIDAEIEARGADGCFERAAAQTVLDPPSGADVERTVVKPDDASPVGPVIEECAIPELSLRSHIGENQRRAAVFDFGRDFGHRSDSKVPRPRKAPNIRRDQRVDRDRFRL